MRFIELPLHCFSPCGAIRSESAWRIARMPGLPLEALWRTLYLILFVFLLYLLNTWLLFLYGH